MRRKNIDHFIAIKLLSLYLLLGIGCGDLIAQMGIDTIVIPVGDEKMFAQHYQGAGDDLKPSVLLLHGFPGGFGDVLGLGEALAKDSINVFTLTLRGIANSEGVYADSSPIVDLREALDFFFEKDNLEKYEIDPNDFIIGGWSFGGGLSLYMGAEDSRISRIISIAGFNGDAFLKKCSENEKFKKFMMAVFATYRLRGMVNFNPKELISDLEKHREKFSPVNFADKIAMKPLLLFGCTDDAEVNLTDHILPYYYAVRGKGGQVEFQVYQTGHRFGGHYEQLAEDMKSWILR